ncbi:general secretion pathway protein-related protein [Anaeromyxobacter sp. K]|uniref:ExeA family protein n=1 Tax=Anaeromyxobacter sp. (strain K) TaxID=447217 RepID=UPI00015F84F3|nr:AAA family ATPase [Anaeromyxobacter sp. K]ACG74051.1 general secretion pathway protein-related protein [Anaeromyxobacter sp. K]
MYLEHFGLARKPFSKTPDPAFLFPSRQHAEALARLSHALEEREVAVLTGEVGAGKTTLSRALVDAFADRCRFSFVVHPALPAAQLLGAIAEGFGLPPARRKADAFSALADHVARLDAEGQFAVVVVDEAQLLPARAAFDELRLLTNLCADDRALVGLVLVGQPELRERLRARGGEAFLQRVGVAYHLGALDAPETGRYLEHRLAVAGRAEALFEPAAVAAVHRLSGGVPRRVNQVAASALLEGFAREVETIGAEVVEAAAADIAAYLGTPGRPG